MTHEPNAPTRARVGALQHPAAFGPALLAAALVALALQARPAAAQDIGSACPVFPGQTHGQIVRGVEGRLQGDWALAIKTTERSAKRLKDKGEDPSQAILFAQVLACLQNEVKAGRHDGLVAEARANPKPELNTATNGRQQGQTAAQPAPAPQPAPGTAAQPAQGQAGQGQTAPGIDVGALAPGSLAGQPQSPAINSPSIDAPAPGTAGGQPTVVDSGGVVLPGTAESYALNGGAQQPQVAAVPADSYVGQACNYFTRPAEEVINGLRHLNRYGEGEWVCHQGQMYACYDGVWAGQGACEQYNSWETRLSSKIEAYPR